MKLFVGVSDGDWYEFLVSRAGLDEVNFWQPGGNRQFKTLAPGDVFLFKLHSPRNFVVGGGVFAHSTLLPASLAWRAFGESNGATTFAEMRQRIERYRRIRPQPHEDYQIGCILLQRPFFLPREAWIPGPPGWSTNIVQGRTYSDGQAETRRLWDMLEGAFRVAGIVAPWSLERIVATEAPRPPGEEGGPFTAVAGGRFGSPIVVQPRLGQGTFRVIVTDAYARRCAITGERTLPVLEAAHIKPYSEGGEHRIDNGLLLRSDLHTLFDRGYVTITPDRRLEVSRRLKQDWENGRDYYAMRGRELRPPANPALVPAREFLEWHNSSRYLG